VLLQFFEAVKVPECELRKCGCIFLQASKSLLSRICVRKRLAFKDIFNVPELRMAASRTEKYRSVSSWVIFMVSLPDGDCTA